MNDNDYIKQAVRRFVWFLFFFNFCIAIYFSSATNLAVSIFLLLCLIMSRSQITEGEE